MADRYKRNKTFDTPTAPEIERQYSGFDHDELARQLAHAGRRRGVYLFRASVFTTPGQSLAELYTRVRDEGHQTTLSVKTPRTGSSYQAERTTVIPDFGTGVARCIRRGLQEAYYIEKIRVIYAVRRTEVVLDVYPGASVYAEIEGPTEAAVREAEVELRLTPFRGFHGIRRYYYETYGIPRGTDWGGVMTFANAGALLGPHLKKNKELFWGRLNAQQALVQRL